MTRRIEEHVTKHISRQILLVDMKDFTGMFSTSRPPPSNKTLKRAVEIWIDASYDPIILDREPFKTVVEKITALNPNTKILTGDFRHYYTKKENILYCPFWFLGLSPIDNFVPKNQRRFKFSCLNRQPKPHRLMNFCLFLSAAYSNDSCVSFWGQHTYDPIPMILNQSQQSFLKLKNQLMIKNLLKICNDSNLNKIFSTLEHLMPYHPYEPDYDGSNDHAITHPAYSDTYINVVTETSCDFENVYDHSDGPLITEKTIKPLLARQLFLMCADSGSVQFLRDIGIDVFDDVIDHGYDSIYGFKEKTYAIHQELDRLNRMDLPTLFQRLEPRLEKNYKKLFDEKFLRRLTHQLV